MTTKYPKQHPLTRKEEAQIRFGIMKLVDGQLYKVQRDANGIVVKRRKVRLVKT